jgi:hypothetical protein
MMSRSLGGALILFHLVYVLKECNLNVNRFPFFRCALPLFTGVVDAHLRVYDIKNVRVVDASIMPLQISAHLSSTVYGIAEKAADLIKSAQVL